MNPKKKPTIEDEARRLRDAWAGYKVPWNSLFRSEHFGWLRLARYVRRREKTVEDRTIRRIHKGY